MTLLYFKWPAISKQFKTTLLKQNLVLEANLSNLKKCYSILIVHTVYTANENNF